MTVIFENCTIFDGRSEDLLQGGSILIEDGIIREVSDRPVPAAIGGDRIDVGGRVVMPGLIDAHFHCYGIEANPARIDAIAPGLRALHARRIMEGALQRGFTTVRDAAGGDHVLAAALDAGLIDGPRLFYPGLAISQTGGHGDPRGPDHAPLCACAYCGALSVVADGPEEMRKIVREQFRQGAHHIKLFVSGGVLSPGDPIWMNQLCDAEISVAVEEAKTRRSYVMAHAHTNDAALRCVALGVRSIEHATMIEDDGVAAIVRHDGFAVPTLAIIDALHTLGSGLGLSAAMVDKVREVADQAYLALDRLVQGGAHIGFGTDLLGGLMDRQSQEFRLRRAVCRPIDILRSATSVNADLIQMTGRLGVIAPGAFADLLVLEGNPLDDVTLFERPDAIPVIMKGGRFCRNALAR